MKLKSFIILSSLLAAMTSCDTVELSDSQPIVNPQEPIFEASGVYVTPSDELTSGDILNLQEMLNEGVTQIDLFTVDLSSSDLPEGADVYGYLELSNSEDFSSENTLTLTNVEIEGSTGVLPFGDLLEAHQTLFGKEPVVKTMYYRIPLYANLGGAVYRLNAVDYYYAEGSVNILGLDPGFTIESTYYILGTKGWNPLEDCVEFNHSSASPYDDPVFNITVTVGANTNFKIVPQSSYELLDFESGETPQAFWNSLVGVATDGDTSLSGILTSYNTETETEAGAIKIEEAGIYNISINMENWTYSIEQGAAMPDAPGLASGIYLRGGMNDWGTSPDYEFLTTEEPGVYVIPYITIEPTEFKIADESWGSVNLGGTGADVVIDQEYPLTGSDNIKLNEAFTGALILTNNDGAYSVLFTEYDAVTEGQPSGIYLRGGMNDWGTSPDYEFVTGPVENVWYLKNQTIGAGVEFKVADGNWGAVNCGTNSGSFDENVGQGVLGLVSGAGNISLSQDFSGTLTLVKVGDYYFLYFMK